MFEGWPDEALEFFEGLEAENTKTYWVAHKNTYDTAVLAPMQALLDELSPRWGEAKVQRPYRDIRFSADKSPYKTHIAARLGPGYVHLSATTFGVGAGLWEVAPDQLERFRNAIVDDASGGALADVVGDMRAKGLDIMSHDALKTAPKGYPKDHPRAEFLKMKGIAAWQEWPAGAWLGTHEAADRVTTFLEAAAPLGDWLAAHVGSSEMAERRRPR